MRQRRLNLRTQIPMPSQDPPAQDVPAALLEIPVHTPEEHTPCSSHSVLGKDPQGWPSLVLVMPGHDPDTPSQVPCSWHSVLEGEGPQGDPEALTAHVPGPGQVPVSHGLVQSHTAHTTQGRPIVNRFAEHEQTSSRNSGGAACVWSAPVRSTPTTPQGAALKGASRTRACGKGGTAGRTEVTLTDTGACTVTHAGVV